MAHRPWLKNSLLTLAFALLLASCGKDNHCGVPFGEGFVIDLTLPEFNDLNHVGGYVTVNRGHKGVFVVRSGISDFIALECSCPHDHETAVETLPGWDATVLICPKCNSTFSVYADGMPIEGSTTPCSLYQYQTHLSDDGLSLYISIQ